MESPLRRNRLASESSTYLIQHAGNPVDWFPWGDEALGLARSLDRPILLSIGYSACHWCHVMERESFENRDIARLMNDHFVCIKVDREERPDLDQLYMKALQGMTGRGGWPMTMFLTPDARPFFAGTYFPPEDRNGMPGFPRVLLGVSKAWAEKRADVIDSAGRMVDFLAGDSSPDPGGESLAATAFVEATETLVAFLDTEHGGFGRAPKFPGTMAISLLMQEGTASGEKRVLDLVRLSLDRMAAGGIRDHLGGGFHRYSVDREWIVPHFEKMLYDQALFATLYLDASKAFRDPGYAKVAEEIFDYVVREMTSPEGGFYSAQDADSEDEEGKFFVWTREEIVAELGAERGARFCQVYGVTEHGNFEGRTILHLARAPAGQVEESPGEARGSEAELAASRKALYRRRLTRVAPGTDRKIVTDWNALMISAMARAGRVLDREDIVDAAERAARFLCSTLFQDSGLRHVYAAGEARIPAFLDDYAFLGRASLDLFVVRPCAEHLETARLCCDRLLEEFLDEERGGFHFTGSRGESLIARTSDLNDGATPAGNSVAAELLLRMWSLTGEDVFRRAGEAVLDRFLAGAMKNPHGTSHLIAVAERYRGGQRTVVVVGEAAARNRLSRVAEDEYDPGCTVIAVDAEMPWHPSALRGKSEPSRGALAYVCEATSCSAPVADEHELRALLRERRGAGGGG